MSRLGMVVMVAAAMVFGPLAHAQQRTSNSGAPGLLRQWPMIGVWQVFLARSVVTHGLTCAMFTGFDNKNSGKRLLLGIRRAGDVLALEVIDSNPNEVAGPSISVTIDGLMVGTYAISRRQPNGAQTIALAELSRPDADTLMNLIRLGGAIKFSTDAATYSASLMGVPVSMMNLGSCVAEMTQLNAAHVSTQ